MPANGKPLAASENPEQKVGYSLLPAQYPHTELEPSHFTVQVSGSSRIRTVPGDSTDPSVFHQPVLPSVCRTEKEATGFCFKDYLFFIYPTHNFW